jgi:cytochrome c
MSKPKMRKVEEIDKGDPTRGERLFRSLCMGCHAYSLRGIYGKNIASGSM